MSALATRERNRVPWLGVVYPADAQPEGLIPSAEAAEELGLGQIWVIEDCFRSSGIALAASALAATEQINLGIGLLPVPLRNPALAAMEIATVARINPGRFTAAFGHGVRAWMEQAGALPARRLQALEEYVAAVRALLRADTVTRSGGYVKLDRVRLATPPASPPDVLVGSTGPRGIEIGHRAADGILLPEGSGPRFVRWATREAEDRHSRCAIYTWLAIDDDPEHAIDRVLPAVRDWSLFEHYPHPHELAGLPGPPLELPDEQLRELAPRVSVAGTPAACAGSIAEFREAGATDLLVMPQGDAETELPRLMTEVIPRLP
jgi:alkanesulfonate monooxygenase SsuD/methylene tetrahydromethanopterin reductase-like flavin-dependent oxidoreductase (luciferase family)